MKEVGRGIFEKDMEFRFGQMALAMKEIGIIIKQMAKENSYMLMVIFTMAIGLMIKLQEKVYITIIMELNMMDSG